MKARKPNNIGVWDDYTQYTALCRKLKIHESQWCAVYGVDDFYIHWNKLLKPKAMTQDTFNTLVTIISEWDIEKHNPEFSEDFEDQEQPYEIPNVVDRLKDGENLIALWVELGDFIAWSRGSNENFTDENQEDLEENFWEAAQEVLVDKD